MTITILAFAQLSAALGWSSRKAVITAEQTPREVISHLAPLLDLRSVRVAIDFEYCSWDQPIGYGRELALIPPVSGG